MSMKTYILIALVLTALISCNRKDGIVTSAADGKIIRVFIPASDHSLLPNEITDVDNLFITNRIFTNNIRFYYYYADSGIIYTTNKRVFYQSVVAQQYVNGVAILNSGLGFNFTNGKLTFSSGKKYNKINLDTTSYLSLSKIRTLFLSDVKNDEHYSTANYNLNDSILKAQFGYYDLNQGTSDTTIGIVKAWKVTLKSTEYPSDYPIGYYQDNGIKIGFNDGILTVNSD